MGRVATILYKHTPLVRSPSALSETLHSLTTHSPSLSHTQSLSLTFPPPSSQVYATAWRKCGIDSMIVPTTQKFMINHLGFFYVLKYPQKDPPTTWVTELNPLLLLDYRCHVENGTIGSGFPPSVSEGGGEVWSGGGEGRETWRGGRAEGRWRGGEGEVEGRWRGGGGEVEGR